MYLQNVPAECTNAKFKGDAFIQKKYQRNIVQTVSTGKIKRDA